MTEHRGVFDFIRSRGERFIGQVSNELMKNPQFLRALQTAWRGKEFVDQAVARAIKTMNIPTRTEFKRAVARIEALEHELAEQKRHASAPAASRPRPARRRPAAKKRKAAKAPARGRRAGAAVGTSGTPGEAGGPVE